MPGNHPKVFKVRKDLVIILLWSGIMEVAQFLFKNVIIFWKLTLKMLVQVRRHTVDKPFKCDHCTYATTEKTALAKHIRTHTKERPYICETCGFQ